MTDKTETVTHNVNIGISPDTLEAAKETVASAGDAASSTVSTLAEALQHVMETYGVQAGDFALTYLRVDAALQVVPGVLMALLLWFLGAVAWRTAQVLVQQEKSNGSFDSDILNKLSAKDKNIVRVLSILQKPYHKRQAHEDSVVYNALDVPSRDIMYDGGTFTEAVEAVKEHMFCNDEEEFNAAMERIDEMKQLMRNTPCTIADIMNSRYMGVAGTAACLYLVAAVFFILNTFADVWPWIGIFSPELYAAHLAAAKVL